MQKTSRILRSRLKRPGNMEARACSLTVPIPGSAHASVSSSMGAPVLNLADPDYLGRADTQPESLHSDNSSAPAADRHSAPSAGPSRPSVPAPPECDPPTFRELEGEFAAFLRSDEAVILPSPFEAALVLFTALLAPDDLVILTDPCPAPLHAAAELAPADVVHVPRGDLEALASTLSAGHPGRLRLLVTEAVSSLDGVPLPLAEMAGLARHHEALLLLDDTEGVGVLGPGGRGSAASLGSGESPFLLTGSASGALGPAKWGFVAGDREVMEAVRFHAASLTGPSACTQDALSAAAHYLHLAVRGDAARTQVLESAAYFRTRLETAAFSVRSGSHPLLAVELPDEASAHKMAAALLADRIVVRPVTSILGAKTNSNSSGPSFLRVKLSAAHYTTELDGAVVSFIQAGRRLGVLPTFCMYQRKR